MRRETYGTGSCINTMWSGSSVLASGDYYRFDFTWKKEKLYDEYGRAGHKNQQQIIG